jgi:hypothetical protein
MELINKFLFNEICFHTKDYHHDHHHHRLSSWPVGLQKFKKYFFLSVSSPWNLVALRRKFIEQLRYSVFRFAL